MELKGTKTEKNLMEAFAGESQARNKYTFFASMAKKEGYEQLAAIFEETAGNEKEHAKIWFKLLCGGAIPDTLTCLDMAAGGEHDEWTEKYPRMAREATAGCLPARNSRCGSAGTADIPISASPHRSSARCAHILRAILS